MTPINMYLKNTETVQKLLGKRQTVLDSIEDIERELVDENAYFINIDIYLTRDLAKELVSLLRKQVAAVEAELSTL